MDIKHTFYIYGSIKTWKRLRRFDFHQSGNMKNYVWTNGRGTGNLTELTIKSRPVRRIPVVHYHCCAETFLNDRGNRQELFSFHHQLDANISVLGY